MATKKLKGSIPVKTGMGSLPMKKRHGARWEKPKVPLWQQHAEKKYKTKRPMDLCKLCDRYAVGCKPLKKIGGNLLRILERKSEERYCARHHPKVNAQRAEKAKKAYDEREVCKGMSARTMPICIKNLSRNRRKLGIDMNIACNLSLGRCFYTPNVPGQAIDAKWRRPARCSFVKGKSAE